MSTTITLLGYPEAVLATATLNVELAQLHTAEALASHVAHMSPLLLPALLREDGSRRQTTKVLVDGRLVEDHANVADAQDVAVLASLPCDG